MNSSYTKIGLLFSIGFLIGGMLLLSSCKSSKVNYKNLPEWITTSISNPQYYIGIGHSKKDTNPTNYKDMANRAALQAMSEEIAVQLKGSTVLVNIEQNKQLWEDFSQVVHIQTNTQLEGYERFAYHETENDYYVGYRLSRQEYQATLAKKKREAIDKAMSFYSKGVNAEQTGSYAKAIVAYAEAIEAGKEYLSDYLYQSSVNDSTNFVKDIFRRLQDITSSITLMSLSDKWSSKYGGTFHNEVAVLTIHDIAQADFPLELSFSGNASFPRFVQSNSKGNVEVSIQKTKSKNRYEQLTIQASMSELLSKSNVNYNIRQWLSKQSMPSITCEIELLPATIYISSREQNMNQSITTSPLRQAAIEQLQQNGYQITNNPSEADFIIHIMSNTESVGQNNGFYTCKLNGTFEIRTVGGKSIMNKSLRTTQGTQLNYFNAGMNAYTEAASQLKNRIVLELETAISQS